MRLTRRLLLRAAAAAAALPAVPQLAQAQSFPTRQVRVIVPFAPGGPVDVFARLLAEKLSEHFGQQFYVENNGGAGGNIGAGRAAKAVPDGYTILLTANNFVINPLLYETVPYDPFKDFAPVSLAVGFSDRAVGQSSVSAHTVTELVALVRANPGKFSFSSPGVGTPSHLLGEQFRQKLGLDLVHVPYSGSGPATEAVMAGDTPIWLRGADCCGAAGADRPVACAGDHEQDAGPVRCRKCRLSRKPVIRVWTARAGTAFSFLPERPGHRHAAQRRNPQSHRAA